MKHLWKRYLIQTSLPNKMYRFTRFTLALLHILSTATPSPNPRKRDSSLAQLSVPRLQQLTSPSRMDSTGGTLHVQEFFFSRSLLSIDAYYMEHEAFPQEWVDMKAFLKTVCIFSS
jgi:hypothetical protein